MRSLPYVYHFLAWKRVSASSGIWLLTTLNLALTVLALGIASPSLLSAQSYLKELVEADRFFGQRMSNFTNGDILIGNSSVEALRAGGGGTLYLSRLDPCGNIIWSQAYHRDDEYMEIKDVLLNDKDEIFAYGSAYIGLDELIFLMKTDAQGNVLRFQLFEPETVDHFSYSIDLRNGLLLVYGLILDFNTKKFGFVTVFNENLTFQWGVKFTPFESSGDAIITSDGGFLCRSGPFLIRLDPTGQWMWGSTLQAAPQYTIIAGPLDVGDGYILEAHREGYGVFFKIDNDGNFRWFSERFPSKSIGATMVTLPNEQILATYSAEGATEAQLCHLTLSKDGNIMERRVLQTDYALNPGNTQLSRSKPDRLVISVDPDRFTINTATLPAFIVQTDWPPVSDECFSWSALPNSELLDVGNDFQFIALDTITSPTTLSPIGNTLITTQTFLSPYEDACDAGSNPGVIRLDSLLNCTDDWEVSLPGPDFVWADGHPEFTRILTTPGTYQARNEDCGELSLVEYILSRENCPCPVYVPTAFSPNGDGQNDVLTCYPSCELADLRFRIFNRWGTLVFDGQHTNAAWDGSHRGQAAASGVYIILVEYSWRNEDGTEQHNIINQELTLVR